MLHERTSGTCPAARSRSSSASARSGCVPLVHAAMAWPYAAGSGTLAAAVASMRCSRESAPRQSLTCVAAATIAR